jgi:hypothetical protein
VRAKPVVPRKQAIQDVEDVLAYYMAEEGWDVWKSLYFLMVTASTVGYGDLYPVTRAGRIELYDTGDAWSLR